MGFNISFNANTVAPNVAPEPVPTGTYDVAIVASEEKPVKNGNGATYYELTMQVIAPAEFKGRKIFERLNCKNPSDQAREIAFATLSSICHVTGVMQLQQSSAELHGKPFKVKVVKGPRNDDPTKEGNEIRGYLDAMGNEPGAKGGSAGNGQVDPNSGFAQNSNANTGSTDTGGTDAGSTDADDIPQRVIDLMVEGMEYEDALAKYEAEKKAAAAAKSATKTPQQIAAEKAKQAAAKAAAAAAQNSGGDAGGDDEVPAWAK